MKDLTILLTAGATLAAVGALVIATGCVGTTSSTFNRITVYTDNNTGCQYVSIYQTSITPRMGKDGKQVCQ